MGEQLKPALERVGLVGKKDKVNIKQPPVAYLFDVDGVLTNPETKQVEHPEIFDELIKRLQQGIPIGLNTGRSSDFMIEQILDPLESRITDKKLLQYIIAIGEKGAVSTVYGNDGKLFIEIDRNISIPQVIQNSARALVSQRPYSETMLFDETKRTMVTIEIRRPFNMKNKSFDDFKTAQKQLAQELNVLLAQHHLAQDLKIDQTRNATDIENKQVGKALGARRFIEILEERGIYPRKYLGFGDSPSDYAMHEELKRLNKQTRFIYVGKQEDLSGKDQTGVIFTQQQVDKGTLKFLRTEHKSEDSN